MNKIYPLTLIFSAIITGCSTTIEIVKDFDGNEYKTVTIGNQEWLMENLKTTHYQNGDLIKNVSSNSDWRNSTTGAYCIYNNDSANVKVYGLLYNWYAVVDDRNICPSGWHVPDQSEWIRLEMKLGGSKVAGGKLKEIDTLRWKSPNAGATNQSRFTALPSGIRHMDGAFFLVGRNACFWSSDESDNKTAWYRDLDYNDAILGKLNNFKNSGLSVRCIKGR